MHFEGLANPTRLLIVERLAATSEMRVSELADYCQVSQPRMSWHLRILRKAEVIRTRRDGREVFCRLDREAIASHFKSFARLISVAGMPAEITSTTPVHEGSVVSKKVKVAIIGVGNCASSFVQGLEYYKHADPNDTVPGLMHVDLGGYHISDIEISAAFDIDILKVGKDVSEAIFSGSTTP